MPYNRQYPTRCLSGFSLSARLRHYPPFVRFWLASTVSDFGTYITGVALSVLVLVSLGGTPLDLGLVNAARWAPYLLFGLLAGIWVDRWQPPFGPHRR